MTRFNFVRTGAGPLGIIILAIVSRIVWKKVDYATYANYENRGKIDTSSIEKQIVITHFF